MNDSSNTPREMPDINVRGFDDNSAAQQVVTTEKVNWTLIALIVTVVIFAGYAWYINKSDDDTVKDEEAIESTTDDDSEVDDTEEIDGEEHADPAGDPGDDASEQEFVDDEPEAVVIPDNWEMLVNASQGYTAYRPSNYWYRIFGGTVLGIDPNKIPEASEYVGIISLQTINSDLASEVARGEDIMDGETVAEVNYANGTWTVVTGTIPEDEMFPARFAYFAFIEVDGKVYQVYYAVEGESYYNQNLSIAKQFTEYVVWEVLEEPAE